MSRADSSPAHQTQRRPRSRWEAPVVGWILLSLPVITVAVVGLAVFVIGAPRSYRGARVWGGPSVGQTSLSARLSAVERLYDAERALVAVPVDVEAHAAGRLLGKFHGTTDGAGFLEIQLPLVASAPADLQLRVQLRGERLAQGRVALTAERWLAGVRR
ncbi:MAG TPA: hypothetical protein VI197_17930, partial [Polyangiaceae bacterium]